MKIKKETAVKILAAMLTLLMLIGCMQSTVLAGNDFIVNPSDIKAESSGASDSAKGAAQKILGIVQVVAVSVAVIMLIVLAIKYISSAPNDKAEIKKHAVIYVVGAILLFGAAGILGLIQQFATDAFGNAGGTQGHN